MSKRTHIEIIDLSEEEEEQQVKVHKVQDQDLEAELFRTYDQIEPKIYAHLLKGNREIYKDEYTEERITEIARGQLEGYGDFKNTPAKDYRITKPLSIIQNYIPTGVFLNLALRALKHFEETEDIHSGNSVISSILASTIDTLMAKQDRKETWVRKADSDLCEAKYDENGVKVSEETYLFSSWLLDNVYDLSVKEVLQSLNPAWVESPPRGDKEFDLFYSTLVTHKANPGEFDKFVAGKRDTYIKVVEEYLV